MGAKCADLVVVLPGIMGSELAKGDRIIWGWSGGVLTRNLLTAGKALRQDLSIAEDSATADSLDDGVVATRLLPDLHIVPGLWKVDGYGAIQEYLRQALEVREGVNFFPFPYDWRRDNRATARRLARHVNGWLEDWRERSGNRQAKLILVAHSMGGLISRYFLEVLGGWKVTRALFTFGTPFAGSLNALETLVNGLDKVGIDLTDVVRRFYSLHQLLPTFECRDQGQGGAFRFQDLALPGIDPQRLEAARKFHEEMAEAAQRNAADDEYVRGRYRMFPIVGYNQPTRQSFRQDDDGVHFQDTRPGAALDGDGTVPRISAIPAGFDLPLAMFASTRHARLQNSPATLAHLVGVVSSLDYPAATRGETIQLPVQLSLDVQDVYPLCAPAVISVRPTAEVSVLRLEVFDCASGKRAADALMQQSDDGCYRHELEAPAAGSYRVVVAGENHCVEPVSDVFEFAQLPPAV